MPTHIALLRAVNVAGRICKMADIRACLTTAGLTDVETYIQSGNVRVRSAMRSPSKVARVVEELLLDGCGFAVPAVVLPPALLAQVYADAVAAPPLLEGGPVRRYVMFLKDEPPPEAAAAIDAWAYDGERAMVVGRAVHVWLATPTQQAKFSNARFERTLGVGTTRDLKVVETLAGRWGG